MLLFVFQTKNKIYKKYIKFMIKYIKNIYTNNFIIYNIIGPGLHVPSSC